MKSYEKLQEWLNEHARVGVAFSGGVDSTFLLTVAHECLGNNVVAFTGSIASQSEEDLAFTKSFCQKRGIKQIVFSLNELELPGFKDNPPERCYLCKRQLYRSIKTYAAQEHIDCLVDGTNLDDLISDRPGRKALQEEGVCIPLADCGFTKAEVRAFSRILGLSTWDKPSDSCLYTRIAFNEEITFQKLERIASVEEDLKPLGLKRVRARLKHDRMTIELEI